MGMSSLLGPNGYDCVDVLFLQFFRNHTHRQPRLRFLFHRFQLWCLAEDSYWSLKGFLRRLEEFLRKARKQQQSWIDASKLDWRFPSSEFILYSQFYWLRSQTQIPSFHAIGPWLEGSGSRRSHSFHTWRVKNILFACDVRKEWLRRVKRITSSSLRTKMTVWWIQHTPRKDGFLEVRKDIYISSEGRKGGIFHTETIFFGSRHPFPHENQAKPPVRVRKWMSRTEKKCRGVKNPPFESWVTKCVYPPSGPENGRFRGARRVEIKVTR